MNLGVFHQSTPLTLKTREAIFEPIGFFSGMKEMTLEAFNAPHSLVESFSFTPKPIPQFPFTFGLQGIVRFNENKMDEPLVVFGCAGMTVVFKELVPEPLAK